MMLIREEFEQWCTGKSRSEKRRDEKTSPGSASRLRYGSLRSPSRNREAEHPPQSVTHAVRRKCYLCGEAFPSLALPILKFEFRPEPADAFWACARIQAK